MDPVTVSVNVDAPREAVFAYLADVAHHPEFLDHMFEDMHLLRADTYGRGAGLRYRTKAPRDRFGWGDYSLLTVEGPHEIVAVGRGGKYNRTKTYWRWTLTASDAASTRVELMFETEPALPTDKIMETLGRRRAWYRSRLRRALKRVRAIHEEGEGSRARGARATVAGL